MTTNPSKPEPAEWMREAAIEYIGDAPMRHFSTDAGGGLSENVTPFLQNQLAEIIARKHEKGCTYKQDHYENQSLINGLEDLKQRVKELVECLGTSSGSLLYPGKDNIAKAKRLESAIKKVEEVL